MPDNASNGALSLSLRLAARDDAAAICDLVNASYRGLGDQRGWTSEADLVAGHRTEVADIEAALGRERSLILVGVARKEIVACVHVEKEDGDAHIGMFSVQPSQQGRGIGKWLLEEAERMAWHTLLANRIIMTVISQRPELLAFYERRGYRRTGLVSPYPTDTQVGVPKVPLTVARLAKTPRP